MPSPPVGGVRDCISVYSTGRAGRPGVIVLHEAGGMSAHCLRLARELADEDPSFQVFLPLLFGKPGQNTAVGFDVRGLWCIRKEMRYFASDLTSPLTGLIRQLVGEVATRTNNQSVGVIGMCLTGNMVFALMADAKVGAAVASQPALPLLVANRWLAWLSPRRKKRALGVAPEDLAASVRSGSPLLALRFAGDLACPAERFASLAVAFGTSGALRQEVLPGKGHSVLTVHRTPENDMVSTVREFLHRYLG